MTPKINQKIIKKIADAVAAGNTLEHSAIVGGVGRKCFYNWRRKGRAARSGIFYDLHAALELADAHFVQRSIALIQAHGRQNWQALAWLLERRHPELFGRYDRMQAQQMKDLADELKLLRGELANKLVT